MISPIGSVSAPAMLRGPNQDHDRVTPPVVATDPTVAAAVESAAYWSIVLPSAQGEGPDAVPLDRRSGEVAIGRVRGLVAELQKVHATLAEAQQPGADRAHLQGALETSLGRVRDLAGAVAVEGNPDASQAGSSDGASSRAPKKLLLSPAVSSASSAAALDADLQYFQIFRISEIVAAGIASLSAIYSLADRISDNATYDRRTRPIKLVAGFSETADLAKSEARLTIMTEPIGGIDLTALDLNPAAREDIAAYAGAVAGTASALNAMAGAADGAA
ncbi:hypothetical protein [Segnochrobactrum spirostomi]|uniref:Uncharacterized protein n=1 Tax=Segnochrobactrum spirostomi TaxID=2608987 RepID=A0A6A7Y1B9_9HYPH|nr:hypothetical protein [Segnochrobactrum spirostomi]MQT12774.1 hypothetical protein [Segnochrobactrum spirostomi]